MFSLRSLLALLCLAAAAESARALDPLEKVAVEVDLRTVGSAFDGAGPQDTQDRLLNIKVENRTRDDLRKLTVKWVFFGEDLANGKVAPKESGTEKLHLTASGDGTLSTKKVSFVSTRAHAEKSGGGAGKKGKGGSHVEHVPAGGVRYYGWAVQVRQGSTVVGQTYSVEEIKKLL